MNTDGATPARWVQRVVAEDVGAELLERWDADEQRFVQTAESRLWEAALAWYRDPANESRSVPTDVLLERGIRALAGAQRMECERALGRLRGASVNDSAFEEALHALRQERHDGLFWQSLTRANVRYRQAQERGAGYEERRRVVEAVRMELYGIGAHEQGRSGAALLATHAARASRQQVGRAWNLGIARFDAEIGGVRNGQVLVLAGRTKVGKSMLMMHFLLTNVYHMGYPLLATREMSPEEMVNRFVARLAGMPLQEVISRGLREAAPEVADMMEQGTWPMVIVPPHQCVTVEQIEAQIQLWEDSQGRRVTMVAADYINMMQPSTTTREANEQERLGEVVRELKDLAARRDVPVIALAQTGRNAPSKLKLLSLENAVGYCHKIVEVADLVIAVTRDPMMTDGGFVLSLLGARQAPGGREYHVRADFERMTVYG